MAFYRREEPQAATVENVDRIIDRFKAGGDWREAMYSAFKAQRGEDPRDYWEELQGGKRTGGYIPLGDIVSRVELIKRGKIPGDHS
jgi:hypothetical protein